MHQNYGNNGQSKFRKTNANTEIYVKNPKENHTERFQYDNGDYNGVSLMC